MGPPSFPLCSCCSVNSLWYLPSSSSARILSYNSNSIFVFVTLIFLSNPVLAAFLAFSRSTIGTRPCIVMISSKSARPISVRRIKTSLADIVFSSIRRSISALMLGFVRFSLPIERAVLSEYPALIAACVALRSLMYSLMKTCCLSVNRFCFFSPLTISFPDEHLC